MTGSTSHPPAPAGPSTPAFAIEPWEPGPDGAPALEADLDALADVLHAVVHDGAGVSFIVPFSFEDARAFWVGTVLPGVRSGARRVEVARRDGRIVGAVQIDLATPPNQRHRAEVMKLLVHPTARRRGLARALMIAIEARAREAQRTLLTLDTWTGGYAEQLYVSLGFVRVGVIPRFARGSITAALEPATFMYKELAPDAAIMDPTRAADDRSAGRLADDHADHRSDA